MPLAVAAQDAVKEIVVHPRASPMAETRKKTVSYADLNLGSKAGQESMVRRIKAAGKEVCSPQPAKLTNSKDYKNCYDGAMSGALADLGNDDVSAMYAKMK
jgi:UrcA family protein